MRVELFILWAFSISLIVAQQCAKDEVQSDLMRDDIMPVLTILSSFPAGFGPFQSLGISIVMNLLDKFLPKVEKPDPYITLLNEELKELRNELKGDIEKTITTNYKKDKQYILHLVNNYNITYSEWVHKGMPKNDTSSGSLYQFYNGDTLELMGGYITRLKGDNYFGFFGLPMFVAMGTAHLGMLHEAAVIGNDHFNITGGELRNYRRRFDYYLSEYSSILSDDYRKQIQSFFEHGKDYNLADSHHIFNSEIAVETLTVQNAFDLAANWTALAPPPATGKLFRSGIPISVFLTRPIYSKATKCDVDTKKCYVSMNSLNNAIFNEPRYRGLVKSIKAFPIEQPVLKNNKYENGPWTLEGLRNYFNDSVTTEGVLINPTKDIVPIYTSVNNNYECVNNGCTVYASGFENIGNKNSCERKGLIKSPLYHGVSRILRAAKYRVGFRTDAWAIEYRKSNNIDRFPPNAEHGLRFPGEYVLYDHFMAAPTRHTPIKIDPNNGGGGTCVITFQPLISEVEKVNAAPMMKSKLLAKIREIQKKHNGYNCLTNDASDYSDYLLLADMVDAFTSRVNEGEYDADVDDMNYVLGGRPIFIERPMTFRLPPRNTGFGYNLRVYGNGNQTAINVNGCVLKKTPFKFARFDIYDGNCGDISLPNTLTIKEPAHFGAIEIIQVRKCSGSEFKEDGICKKKFCKDNSDCQSPQTCQDVTSMISSSGGGPFKIQTCLTPKPTACTQDSCDVFCGQTKVRFPTLSLKGQCEADGCQCRKTCTGNVGCSGNDLCMNGICRLPIPGVECARCGEVKGNKYCCGSGVKDQDGKCLCK